MATNYNVLSHLWSTMENNCSYAPENSLASAHLNPTKGFAMHQKSDILFTFWLLLNRHFLSSLEVRLVTWKTFWYYNITAHNSLRDSLCHTSLSTDKFLLPAQNISVFKSGLVYSAHQRYLLPLHYINWCFTFTYLWGNISKYLADIYGSLRRPHVHWWHAKLLTAAVHVTNRLHHGVDVARLVRNHRNFGLRLQTIASTASVLASFVSNDTSLTSADWYIIYINWYIIYINWYITICIIITSFRHIFSSLYNT